MRRLGIVLPLTLALALAATASVRAQPRADGTQRGPRVPVPLDGVAAVVDSTVIFRSDIIQRSRPFLERLSKDPIQRRTEMAELHKELLEHMIDEIVVAKDATAAHIEVSDAEVSAAITQVAAQNKMDRKQLEAEVKKQGMSQREYEDEIKKQLIEGKWLNLRIAGKIDRVATSDPARLQQELLAQRALFVAELRNRAYIEIR